MKNIIITLLVCSLAVLGGCDSPQPVVNTSNAKVVLLVIDSLRYDHLEGYGYERETAPYLAELIREGVDFTRAFSPSNYTVMSVPGIFLGKPVSHLYDPHPDTIRIPQPELTLAESFERAGYETYLWSSNLHLRMNGYPDGFTHRFSDYLQTRGTVTMEGMIREMEAEYQPAGTPEFHYVHTMDAHFPYRPPHPYERMFRQDAGLYDGTVSKRGEPLDDRGHKIFSNLPHFSEAHSINRNDISFLIDTYDGAIRYTDDHLGELLGAIGYEPDRDMLIVTSDHGEQFFSHGYWGHNRLLLTQETHVPLIIKAPGLSARTITDPVSLMDLYPTLATMLGLERRTGMTGVDLSDALRGDGDIDHAVYMENVDRMGSSASMVTPDGYLYSFVANRFPMMPWVEWPVAASVYDLNTDQACENDLWGQSPERDARMHAELQALNPRWSPFTFEMIGGEGRNVGYGEDLFGERFAHHVVDGDRRVDASAEVALDAATPSFRAMATTDHAGALHTLSFEYEVSSPYAEFSLHAAEQTDPIWTYPVTIESGEPRRLQATLRIEQPEVALMVRVGDGGAMRLWNAQLRRIDVPDIAPKPDPMVYNYEEDAPETEMSQEEIDALEAIGYVR